MTALRSIPSPNRPKLAATLLALALVTPTAAADTFDVPGDLPTVEAAIAAAVSGDRVRIAAGTFVVGELDFGGKNLRLEGAGIGQTILDANFAGRHLVFQNGENASSEVYGITFTHGRTTGNGGSILILDASPQIYDCEFVDNATVTGTGSGGLGGALYLEKSSSEIRDCTFLSNAAADGAQPASGDGKTGGHGGAIAAMGSSCRILRCVFDANSAGAGGDGALSGGNGGTGGRASAVYFRSFGNDPVSDSSLEQCELIDGSSGPGGLANPGTGGGSFDGGASGNGGLMYVRMRDTDSLLIDRCKFEQGVAPATPFAGSGGGLFVRVDGSDPLGSPAVLIRNSAFRACSAASIGGAIRLRPFDTTIELVNLTISDCSAAAGGAVHSDGPGVSMVNSIAWSCGAAPLVGVTATYSLVEGGYTGTGNFDADPLLDTDGVHLTDGSPCIDAGDATVASAPLEDFDGESRADYAGLDIGADEFSTVIRVPSPQAPTIDQGIEIVAPGGRVLVAPGTYSETGLNFDGKDLELIGEGGSSQTTIDADLDGRHFRFRNGETSAALVQGFRLTRGNNSGRGGSIDIDGAGPTLRDIHFDSNNSVLGGGALYLLNANGEVVIDDCRFEDNRTYGEGGSAGHGGAVLIDDSSVRFVDCSFESNRANEYYNPGFFVEEAVPAGRGGAVFMVRGGPVTFEGCSFELNRSGGIIEGVWGGIGADLDPGHGGAIYASANSGPLIVDRCRFTKNSTGDTDSGSAGTPAFGGDIYAAADRVDIRACFSYLGFADEGQSIAFSDTSNKDRRVLNCTIRHSWSSTPRSAITLVAGAKVEIRNSIVRGAPSGGLGGDLADYDITYSNVEGGAPGVGNVDLDPKFKSTSDYQIKSSSPCVDAGSPVTGGLLVTDLGGDPIGCTVVDIGADELLISSEQVTRVGSIWPNPTAFQPAAVGPVVGTTWQPWIDHTSFVPAALVDFVGLATASTELPFGGGSLLVDLGTMLPLETTAPGQPFVLPIPDACELVGLTLYSQGGSVDSTGEIHMANGLDLVLGQS